ncbi:hypothetical protein [Prevotella sp. OH937_COT-195]|uniref:hypothetical protein n=1 Tax=Prevotella sp. OH937_COT-195 TaxID=2491051 RepID=UPI000F653D54|nr:hypothetical protein [Prevotella sp. OH937_COT-195]RRD02379.1 hypothetical protein EII32_02940 [Prevotella sp. OH937_COT-195]
MTETNDIPHYNDGDGNGLRIFSVYLAFAAVFLFITSLQGISYFDTGIYISGYRHFNDDPLTTYYLGQWYLTYHLCGTVCNFFGIDTLLSMRLLRIVLLLALQTIIYLYLRKLIKTKYIIAGLAMTVFAQYGAYSEINYNDLSIFMLVCAILLYHKGLHSDRRQIAYIAMSGLVIGISFFLRLVNLSFLLLPFYAMVISKYYGIKICWQKHLMSFFTGMAAGCLLVICTAWVDGTSGVLRLTMTDLISISGDGNDPHNMKSIIRYYLEDILGEMRMALFMAFVMYGFILAGRQTGRMLLHTAFSILAAAIILVVRQDGISANATVGFCIAVFLLDIYGRKSINLTNPSLAALIGFGRSNSRNEADKKPSSLIVKISSLTALSMFIPLVFPAGSNGTSQFYGQCMCILALPLAVSVISRGNKKTSFRTETTAVKYIVASICIGLTVTNIFRPMMEDGNRIDCRYTIDSNATRHLFTNKNNADLHNKMIKEVKPRIPRGSHLICNFSITMISVLECKPYGIFTDVFSTPRMAERYLRTAYERGLHGKRLPYLLVDEEQETERFRHVREVLYSISPYEKIWHKDNYVLLKPKENCGN